MVCASSAGPITATKSPARLSSPTGPRRAQVARRTAARASQRAPRDVVAGGGRARGAPQAQATRSRRAAWASAQARNRRSHPRTVVAGRPSRTAIGRWPRPRAAKKRAAATLVAASRRPGTQKLGRSACVPPHERQRARAIRRRTTRPPRRTLRTYPRQRPAISPPQSGHLQPAGRLGPTPRASIGSTSAANTPTISRLLVSTGPR